MNKRLLELLCASSLLACSTGGEPGTSGTKDTGALAEVMKAGADFDPRQLEGKRNLVLGKDRGRVHMVRAATGTLVDDDASIAPAERARAFLAGYGAVIGMTKAERAQLPVETRAAFADGIGHTVRLMQRYAGLPVFGAEVVVGMNDSGITSVNGTWLGGLTVPSTPKITAEAAYDAAMALASKLAKKGETLVVKSSELGVFRKGLVELKPTTDHLGWNITVSAGHEKFMVWVDAITGEGLAAYPLNHAAKRITSYQAEPSPDVDPDPNPYQPGLTAACWTDSNGMVASTPLTCTPGGFPERLFRFSDQVYETFFDAFGRDSYDGMGIRMRTVNLLNSNCPNAYWDGATTNYCPAFELDDVVAHEWGHAYTQYTHNLIYAYQSGALNESYSDIWGENVDLWNNEDGNAGSMNDEPPPNGVRWQVGEDFGTGTVEYELLLRDMWDPDRLNYPGKVTSPNYTCAPGDGGGVHTNSGVPNHAYALLVDGTSRLPMNNYNGVTITGIGFAKAAAIYWRAQTTKQTPTTNFAQHADALEASCAELIGQDPKEFLTLPAKVETITQADCEQVAKAMEAVEMRTPPNCEFEPLLQPNPPAACVGATARLTENWSDGLAGWERSSDGVNAEFPADRYRWEAADMKPAGKPGKAAFAKNWKDGTCAPGGDFSGVYSLASPTITAPAAGTKIEVRFDHYVETELSYDGGQLYYAIGAGAFQLVPRERFTFNGYNTTFAGPPPVGNNTNPRAGEDAWTGADEGGSTSSWGTSVVDLTGLVQPGQAYRLRFDFSADGCNGVTGWYIGDLVVNDCPDLKAPALTVTGVENNNAGPDTNGQFTLNWTRPAPATGPDDVQQSTRSCTPLLDENANGALSTRWTSTGDSLTIWGAGTKQGHATQTYRVQGNEADGVANANLVTKMKYRLPAGKPAKLSFDEWYSNEPDDFGYVEVCKAAMCNPDDVSPTSPWEIVYTNDRSLDEPNGSQAFATEDLTRTEINLSAYAGQEIQIRFRYSPGNLNYFFYTPYGWYLDNIKLETDDWTNVLTDGNVQTLAIAGRPDGTYCYRARTTYTINAMAVDSPWSNIVTVVVDQAQSPADQDMDTIPDTADNCVTTPNTDQADADDDGAGDVCDVCFGAGGAAGADADADGYCDGSDNCPAVPNPTQSDSDGNGTGDACDCGGTGDSDGDTVCDAGDNCPAAANTNQADTDGDTVGDACDVCSGASNTDGDADAVCDEVDNCPAIGNTDQLDEDLDGVGDACDCVAANDQDADGACDATDNCPMAANPDQDDTDGDMIGDLCDVCAGPTNVDGDGDKVCDANDNCPMTANMDQADADGDGTGDACADGGCADGDDDGICDSDDVCPFDPNPDQESGFCAIDDGGCGCASSNVNAGAAVPWLVVGALVLRRRRRKAARAVASAAAAGLVAVTGAGVAAADETESKGVGLELGGFGVGFIANENHEFYNYMTTEQAELGSVAPGFGLRLGVFPLPFLGLEAEGQLIRSSVQGRESVNLFGFGGHVILQVPGRVRPFVLGGGGGMGVRSSDSVLGDDFDGMFYGGLGVAVDMTKTVALRLDGRVIRAPRAEMLVEDKGTNHFSLGLGVSGVFGVGGGKTVYIEKPVPEQPADPDGDGIFGAADRCPDGAENVNSWEDTDGCPDTIPDTDSDGLNDVADKCRDNAEDVDSFQDEDGCPEADNDADGVADAADKCPIVLGPIENAGCPDSDRDKDTVVDRLDNCPDEVGTVENHGCKEKQLVVITPTKLQILEIVYFQVGKANLLARSNKLLDQVAKVLSTHPEIAKIRVEGHTDDQGNDANNMRLSQKRADAVVAYLVKRGVDKSRLEAKGFGETVPLDPAKTAEARAANRRVEFNIVPATPDAAAPTTLPATQK